MKLEIGMYVRTRDGIKKINHSVTKSIGLIFIDGLPRQESDVLKASFNLIDLIEVGDYVNGEIVKEVYIADELNEKDSCIEVLEEYLYVDDIKEILTHEQYEANCYKVGE